MDKTMNEKTTWVDSIEDIKHTAFKTIRIFGTFIDFIVLPDNFEYREIKVGDKVMKILVEKDKQ